MTSLFGFGPSTNFNNKNKNDSDSDSDEEKVVKKKGPRYTYLSQRNYSKKYAHLFQNEKYSDCKIRFEKSKKVVPAHKIILTSSSEYFKILFQSKMMEDQKSEILIDKEENEEFFMKFIEFLYTGSFDYSKEQDIIHFIMTSNKYLVKVDDFKIPSKKLLKIIISYIEKDFDNRIKTFDSLVQYVDFKVFEKEELLLIFKRVKWMSTSLVFLAAILQKDVEEDLDDDIDEKEEEIEFNNIFKSESEQISSDSTCMLFDKKNKGSKINLSKNGKVVTYTGSGWQGAILGKSGNKYSVKIKNYAANVMFGFATKNFYKEGNNYTRCGYYLYFNGLTLYGQPGSCTSGQQFGGSKGFYNTKVGDVIGARWDKRKKEISFYYNGKSMGVAFRNVKEKKLIPCIDFSQSQASLELVKGKYPKK